ncbi:MAG: RagB/SusD family nutrient uptake outer membrane protein [Parabacteroides sp.]|nr:RagB/SusD family nutrient uptake outer membrane protein [Parabacteroides sp.]
MRKIKLYLTIVCCVGLFFTTGCYELEQYPSDAVVVDFNNQKQTYEALIGVYQALNQGGTYKGYYSRESISDLGWSNNGWWPSYDKYDIGMGTANAYYGGFSDVWQAQYDGISRANKFIGNVASSTLPAGLLQQYIAEARFLRALYYDNLLMDFGGVPIYDETNSGNASEMLHPRNTAEEVRAFIIKDLDFACQYLPKTRGDSVGLASQGAAYSLRGKVYLYNKQYDLAKADFLQVVNGGYGYTLNSSYADLFRPAGYEKGADNCSEIIFAVEHMGGTSTNYGMHVQFLGNRASYGGCINTNVASRELVNMYECKDGKPYNRDDFFKGISDSALYLSEFDKAGAYVVKYPSQVDKLKAMYAQRDPRMNATIILPYTKYAGWYNNAKMDCEMVLSGDGAYHSYEGNGYVRNAYAQDTYLWRKFVQEYDWNGQITGRDRSPVNWPVIRYADVLLMLAECYNQTGDQSNAVKYINQVRARVGMPGLNSGPSWLIATSQDAVFERIKHERAVEFALEGLRYNDLKRWGQLVEKTNGQKETDIMGRQVGGVKNIDSKYNLWAIPGSEIDINAKLTQNPGW